MIVLAARLLFVAFVLVFPLSASVHGVSDAPDEALPEELEAIDRRLAQIEDLTAEFEQRKYAVLLREPLVSRGSVRVRGSRMRWDTVEPAPSATLVDETTLRIHYPEHRTLEVYPLDHRLASLAASPLPRMSILRQHFEVRRDEPRQDLDIDHLALRLVPRDEQLVRYVKEVRIAIDSEKGCLLWMRMVDVDEERTEIRFHKHRLNTGLSEEELDLVVPAGTRTIHPIGESQSPNDLRP